MKTLFPTAPIETAYEQAPSSPLQLPEPQPRYVQPEPPGKREDGKLWFEGALKRSTISEDHLVAKRGLTSYGDELKPRDFRKGDRWLSWHFDAQGNPKK